MERMSGVDSVTRILRRRSVAVSTMPLDHTENAYKRTNAANVAAKSSRKWLYAMLLHRVLQMEQAGARGKIRRPLGV